MSGDWRQVCSMSWAGSDAQVVCRQLGYNGDNRKSVMKCTSG